MNMRKILIYGSIIGAVAVVASQRKKIMALIANDQAAQQQSAAEKIAQAAQAAANSMPFGEDAPPLATTTATTQSIAQIADTMVKSLTGLAGLALVGLSIKEKKKALEK